MLYVYMHLVNVNMPASAKLEIDWKAVGRRVREARGFGVNQTQFALELGISQGQLSRYEKAGSEIGGAVLLRLARKSGKTIEWLLTGRDTL
jgi:transcriptional regulator with XRE-family HTH domain